MFDVIIIGAGPAGTAAAFDLLSNGLKVLLLDKYEFPRKKACAGGITPKGYHLFRYDISSVVKRECRTVRICPPSGRPFDIKENVPLCYMTQREELDLLSLNRVIEKGGDFRVIKKINSITETSFSVAVDTDSGRFKAAYLVGADGANSLVRRTFSNHSFCQKSMAIEADVKLDRADRYQMEFDFSLSLNGYYWIFPKDEHINIGIYSVDPVVRLRTKDLFAYARKKRLPGRLEAIKGYPIGTGGYNYRPDSHRILLAGDAAGMSERLFGEGIFFAVKSGQQAALSIIDGEANSLSVRDLYLSHLKEIQADLKMYYAASRCLYRYPGISLKAASYPFVHKPFSRGVTKGKSLKQMVSFKSFLPKEK